MGAIQNIVNELRNRGITVHEWSGWQNRGNGNVKDLNVKGIILHHTGSGYGSAYAELVSSSQPWAGGGALCNFSGNADGSLTVIAAGLTYHAGGGFGPNQGPLAPYASNRNYYTVGLEIVYPGSQPMTSQQYETAVALSRVVVDLYAGGDAEYVRAHAEVNGKGYEGKWDPGRGVGTEYIDMNAFRNAVRDWSEEDFMTDVYDHVVTVNNKQYSIGSALHYLIAAEHARSGVPGDVDGKVPGDVFGTPLFTDNFGTPEQKVIRLRDFYRELRERAVADVDEDLLAEALAERGIGGASPAEVKEALIEVLRKGTDG